MALTPSNMLPLGSIAPNFTLPDVVSGKMIHLTDHRSNIATVIMFICNHCPYVKYIQQQLIEVANQYQKKGVVFIAINSNDVIAYPDDAPEKMKQEAVRLKYPFVYLFDETQEIAKAYQAACTPDFYVFDKNLACVYRGQFDDARPGNSIPVTGKDLTHALDCLINNEPVLEAQKPSIGCNIKWKND